MGPDRIHQRVSRKPVGNAHQATFHQLPTFWYFNGESLRYLEAGKCDTHLQEGPEGWFRELEACQPNLGAREGHGTGHSECHHMAYAGIRPNQHKHQVMYERQVLLEQSHLHLQQSNTWWMRKRLDIVYLEFSKPLTLFPTAFSWKNCLLNVWKSALFGG